MQDLFNVHQPQPATDDSLPLWQQSYRALPNAIARSALFNTANLRSGGDREYCNAVEVAATKGILITYTGEELRQDDEDVFLQVLHLAKEQKLGEDISFTANSMIVSLEWIRSGESFRRLHQCMRRMKATAIELTVETPTGGKVGFSGSLLSSFQWREDETDDPSREWKVSLEKNIVKLFDPTAYSLIHWNTRLSLSPLARWLHSYYSTHKEPFPVKVNTLHKLTASKAKELRTFRAKLKLALTTLVEKGFLLHARIDPKSDLVYVERKADRRLLE